MKKLLFAGALLITATAFGQVTQTQVPANQTGAQPAQPQGQTKTIANAEEYSAYMAAKGQQDPAAKAAAFEAFVQQYPNSVVKEEALGEAMAAYQQAGDLQKSAATAAQILQVDPNNVRALVVQTYVKRSQCAAMAAADQTNCYAQVGQMAQNGLQQLANYNPAGVSAQDLQTQKNTFSQVFNGAAGEAAFAQKNFADAQKYLSASVQAQPNNVQDVYPLALAYAQQTPPTDQSSLNGIFYLARVFNLLSAQAAQNPRVGQQAQKIGELGLYYLKKYHGPDATDSQQLWDQVVAAAKANPAPPANLAQMVPKAPSPEELVRQKLAKNPDITQLTFGEWEEIFQYGDEQAKQIAFAQIQNKPFKFGGAVVLGANEDSVDLALSYDDIQSKTIDAHVQMVEPFKKVPEVGSEFAFQGNPISFTNNPFVMQFEQGVDLTKRAAAKKPAPKAKAKAKSRRR